MDILAKLQLYLSARAWSPYLVGIGIGILSWLAFLPSNHPIEVSTALSKSAGMIEKVLRGPKVLEKLYYPKNPPQIDWEWMFVVGLFFGALTASWLADDIAWRWMPAMWQDKFGSGILLRLVVAVPGGIRVGFGARWGRGCTSGHGISGTLQLVLSSWLAVISFFIGGITVAAIMYKIL